MYLLFPVSFRQNQSVVVDCEQVVETVGTHQSSNFIEGVQVETLFVSTKISNSLVVQFLREIQRFQL
jgi:hypothetical protein